MPPLHLTLPRSRTTVLVGLLVLTVALAALLVNETLGMARAHRRSARLVAENYAALAADEIASGFEKRLDATIGGAIGPLTNRAVTGNEPLPLPGDLLARLDAPPPCAAGESAAPIAFRLDLRDGSVATAGAPASAALQAWIASDVAADVRHTFRPDLRFAIVRGRIDRSQRAAVYGVKYAAFGAPIAAFGVVTCASTAERTMDEAQRLAPPFAGAEFVQATVTAPAGGARESTLDSGQIGAVHTFRRIAGIQLRAVLRAETANRLTAGPSPESRLPLFLGLLTLTVALAVVALLQLRREHDLARLRADFTSSVSHEMRTPIAQILLFGETLQLGRARTDDDRQLAAETIVQEARRLMHLVENVLRFAGASRASARIEARAEDIAPLVKDVADRYVALAEAAHTIIEVQAGDRVTALVDPDAVRQIVLNLLDNAVKYGPAGQTVTVSVDRDARRAFIIVEDQGPGVKPTDQERIWLPFVRGERAAGTRAGGTGLGLAVVRELARTLGGDARVETPGDRATGARFIVELPLAADGGRA
jgi:signal transduction histidine kinase